MGGHSKMPRCNAQQPDKPHGHQIKGSCNACCLSSRGQLILSGLLALKCNLHPGLLT